MNAAAMAPRAQEALTALTAVHGQVGPALKWAEDVGEWAPPPGAGSTRALWEFFVQAAAVDLAAVRVMEPHLDALAILSQVPESVDLAPVGADGASSWGVFAAEAPGAVLNAVPCGEGWVLDGVKPWCSLAGRLSHALVTATLASGARRLFAVSLTAPGVTTGTGPWVPRGLSQIVSAPVRFTGVPAVPIGAEGWYLERPGFFWGGIGVAACWLGGAIGAARELAASARRREPDQLALAHLGAVDAALTSALTMVVTSAATVDDPAAAEPQWPILMLRTRNVVAAVVEDVLARVGHALGPAPLALNESHAARVADLQLYVRQHHAERDDAALGRALLSTPEQPW